jgi:hypothetical protein
MLVRCVICGKEFEKRRHGPSKYCSAECRRAFELQEHHRKRAERGLPKLGDQIACERCGKPTARRSRSKHFYCEACASERRKETIKAWVKRNPETVKAREERRNKRPTRIAWKVAYGRLRSAKRQALPRGRLDNAMMTLIRMSTKRGTGKAVERFAGYGAADLRMHIGRQFLPGMTWDNMKDWQIDHIVPKSAFTYSSPDDAEFRACWALTNLRPLWKLANVRKSAKRTHLL